MPYPDLSMIVARSRNNIIGVDGDLPWRLSSDLKFFKRTTLGKPVLMGRVTWESLPFPLPGRPNLILTRDREYAAKGGEVFHSVRDLVGRGFELAGELGVDEFMVIGGAQLYARLLPVANKLYVTNVEVELDGDAVFPNINPQLWRAVDHHPTQKGDGDDHPFSISVYERINIAPTYIQ